MASVTDDEIHTMTLRVPKTWVPQIDCEAEDEGRSRHNMILRLMRESLDNRGWKSNVKP